MLEESKGGKKQQQNNNNHRAETWQTQLSPYARPVCLELVFCGLSPNKSSKQKKNNNLSAHSFVTYCCCSSDAGPLVLGLSQCLRLSSVHSVLCRICTKVPAFYNCTRVAINTDVCKDSHERLDSRPLCRRGNGTVQRRTFAVPLLNGNICLAGLLTALTRGCLSSQSSEHFGLRYSVTAKHYTARENVGQLGPELCLSGGAWKRDARRSLV